MMIEDQQVEPPSRRERQGDENDRISRSSRAGTGRVVNTVQQQGLTTAQAKERLRQVGRNVLFTPQPVRFWAIAAEEVQEPMIILLLVVGVAYSFFGNLADAGTIFAVIAVLVLVEVYNEFRAKRSIAALEQMAAPKALVLRDGTLQEIDATELVPGDLLVLTAGTRLAADAELTKAVALSCDESALSGESFPVAKEVGAKVYAGSVVVSGEGEAVVTATGHSTRLGAIGLSLQEIRPMRTPLQLAMRDLAGKLVWVAGFFAVLIPAMGILQGQDWRQMILTGMSLAFATIPEELPIIITMVLGLGSYALSRQRFLVKHLAAAETMGDVTVIVTDKTGTITESRMQLAACFPPEQTKATLACAMANVAEHIIDPLEAAIAAAARQHGVQPSAGTVLRLRPLGQGRRTKTVLRQHDNTLLLTMSGAPEEIAQHAAGLPAWLDEQMAQETAAGRRLIAVAQRKLDAAAATADWDQLEQGLEVVGLLSFEDPPRQGVRETIARAKEAGVRTIMVTGDHPATAAAIARAVGIPAERVITGEELDRLDEVALQQATQQHAVFARTTPQHKYRIVQALQRAGEIVAVTGDGINDALALRAADVGIAMGQRGTDVAREAADIVLADDNYLTLTKGLFEGRKFYDNLKKGVTYYLAVKLGLILIFLVPVLFGLPMPFAPIQIIVLELFMDLAASAGFVTEAAEKTIYSRRPKRRGAENLLDAATSRAIVLKGLLLFVVVMVGYGLGALQDAAHIQTAAFSAWMVGHVTLAFISRSETQGLFAMGVLGNRVMDLWALGALAFLLAAMYIPPLQTRFFMQPLPWWELLGIMVLTIALTSLAELAKFRGMKHATA